MFYGFAAVILIDAVLAGMLNPDRGEAEFWIKLIILFGGLLVWAAWIGRRLNRGDGIFGAFWFLGLLSGMIFIAWRFYLGGLMPAGPPFHGKELMLTARTCSGLYLAAAWIMLIWEVRHHRTAAVQAVARMVAAGAADRACSGGGGNLARK